MAEQPEKQPEEQPAAASPERGSRRRRFLAGGLVAAVLLALTGGWLYHHFLVPAPPAAVAVSAEAALLNLQDVMAAHPRYAELQQLREEAKSLRLSLEAAADLEPPELTVEPPEVESKPFDDSVWQKNAQAVIGERVALAREQKQLREKYRKEHEAEYLARRDALDEEYRNTILNLQLKLDNAELMNLSQANVDSLQQELTAVKKERGHRQWQMYQAWQQEIGSYVQSVMGPKIEVWQAKAQQAKAQQQAAALARQSEAQKRDTAAMSEQLNQLHAADPSGKLQEQLQKQQALQAKQDEINALEAHILNDIAGRAAKLAILHHYTLILATPSRSIASYLPAVIPTVENQERYTDVTGVTTDDITDEMVTEIQSL